MTTEDINSLLISAALDGNVLEVQRLISVCGSTSNTEALSAAAQNGHTECVRLLIPVSEPKVNNSQALVCAALHGHTECVRLLIPVSEPKANNSEALDCAAQFGHNDCIDLLFECSDSVSVLTRLKDTRHTKDMYYNTMRKWAKWGHLEDKVFAQQQNERIHQHVDTPGVKHTKKM